MLKLSKLTPWQIYIAGLTYLLSIAYVTAASIRPDLPSSARVLASLWASGDALLNGLNPYGQQPMTWIITLAGPDMVDVNLNPPSLLPIFHLLALTNVFTAARILAFISALTYLLGIAWLVRYYPSRIQLAWALLLPMASDTLELSQIYMVLFACTLVAWIALQRGEVALAGIALGVLVAMKPNFGMCLVALMLSGQMTIFVWASLTAAVLSGIPVLLYGTHIYEQWLTAIASDVHFIFPTEASLTGYFSRLGVRYLGLGLAALTAIAALVVIRVRRPSAGDTLYIGLLISVLCSPLAWSHYMIVLLPFLLTRTWSNVERTGAALLFVPTGIILIGLEAPAIYIAFFGGIYTLAALLLLFDKLRVYIVRPEQRQSI